MVLATTAKEHSNEVSVYGLVHELDLRTRTFQLTLLNGEILSQIPVEHQYDDAVLKAFNGFRDRVKVRIEGTGRFDRDNQLQSIEKIDRLTIIDPLDINARLDEFKLLQTGWLDGKGEALTVEGLNWLATSFSLNYPDDLPSPYLFPTPEGGVLAEWSFEPWAPSLEIELHRKQGIWHALNLETDEETVKALDLTNTDDWKWLVEQLRNLRKGK